MTSILRTTDNSSKKQRLANSNSEDADNSSCMSKMTAPNFSGESSKDSTSDSESNDTNSEENDDDDESDSAAPLMNIESVYKDVGELFRVVSRFKKISNESFVNLSDEVNDIGKSVNVKLKAEIAKLRREVKKLNKVNAINKLESDDNKTEAELECFQKLKAEIAELHREVKNLNKVVATNALESHNNKAELECFQLKKTVLELSAKCAEQDENLLLMKEDFEERIHYLTRDNELQKGLARQVNLLEYEVHALLMKEEEDSDEK